MHDHVGPRLVASDAAASWLARGDLREVGAHQRREDNRPQWGTVSAAMLKVLLISLVLRLHCRN